MSDKIVIKSSITVKKSSDVKEIKHKATAGLSEAEAIERHTIGEYEEDGDEEKQD